MKKVILSILIIFMLLATAYTTPLYVTKAGYPAASDKTVLLAAMALANANNAKAIRELGKEGNLILLKANVPVVIVQVDVEHKLIQIKKVGTNITAWTFPKAVKRVDKNGN